jgi:hypothetical protein
MLGLDLDARDILSQSRLNHGTRIRTVTVPPKSVTTQLRLRFRSTGVFIFCVNMAVPTLPEDQLIELLLSLKVCRAKPVYRRHKTWTL